MADVNLQDLTSEELHTFIKSLFEDGDIPTGADFSQLIDLKGDQGEPGEKGLDGKDAYQTWLDLGNHGTPEEFLQALRGPAGAPGAKGDTGERGINAYTIWQNTTHNSGTMQDFINYLVGPAGPAGPAGKDGKNGKDGLTGPQGIQGKPGLPGKNGLNGTNGIRGAQGVPGPTGPQGERGYTGATGPQGPQGAPGTNGKNGNDGLNGQDGKDAELNIVSLTDWEALSLKEQDNGVYFVGAETISVNNIVVTPATLKGDAQTSVKLSYEVLPTTATDKTVSIKSSDTNVITVTQDDSGNWTANLLTNGKATISIVSNSNPMIQTTVPVVIGPVVTTAVTGLSVGKQSIVGNLNDVVNLAMTVTPSDATDKEIQAVTTNSDVVGLAYDLDNNAYNLTLKKVGVASVIFTSISSPDVGVVVPVTVAQASAQAVTGLTTDTQYIMDKVGNKPTITWTVAPTTATDTTVLTKSTNPDVAEIVYNSDTKAYQVNLKKAGVASLTIYSKSNPEIYVDIPVTVDKQQVIPVDTIVPNVSSIDGKLGNLMLISWTVTPSNATNQTVLWDSSDESVATVVTMNNQSYVSLKKVGMANLTLYSQATPGVSTTIVIKVSDTYVPGFFTLDRSTLDGTDEMGGPVTQK